MGEGGERSREGVREEGKGEGRPRKGSPRPREE